MTPETSSSILPRFKQRAVRTEVSTCTISPRFGWENNHIGIDGGINTYFADFCRFFSDAPFFRGGMAKKLLTGRLLGDGNSLFKKREQCFSVLGFGIKTIFGVSKNASGPEGN